MNNVNGGIIRGLDYGCGIGRMTMLMHEFKIDSYGVDISKSALQKARELFPNLSENFTEVDGELLCGSCGAMFEMNDERSCPSCGVFDE